MGEGGGERGEGREREGGRKGEFSSVLCPHTHTHTHTLGLMCDLLWSDPQPLPGRGPSKRGVGVQFGPDVTDEFCSRNGIGTYTVHTVHVYIPDDDSCTQLHVHVSPSPSLSLLCMSLPPSLFPSFSDLVIRSHEVKEEGYEIAHGGKCITVFSAPNYW